MKQKPTYHIAVVDAYNGPEGPYSRTGTVYLEARRSIDFLSCEALSYYGQRQTTKQELRAKGPELLKFINEREGTRFRRLSFRYL